MRFLYKITNLLNNKVYIGQSYSEIERWRQHKYCARSKPKQYIDAAIKKYGIINFIYEVICVSLSQEDTDFSEIELIKQYNSRDRNFGYNISPGGDKIWNKGLSKEKHPFFGRHHSEESKKKMSESRLGISVGPHSDEIKKKMSIAKIGKICTKLHCQNIGKSKSGKNNPWFGKHRSEETRKKMSLSSINKIHSEETRKKMSVSKTGSHHSEETKKKISEKLIGENGPNSKLSNIQRLEIFKKRKDGIKIKILAEEYNVSKMTIMRVCSFFNKELMEE